MRRTLAPLRNPLFRRLWVGNMSASLGTVFQSVAAAWLMLTMTSLPQMVALVQTSVTFPLLALSLFAGVLADTFDRRKVLLMSQFYMATVALGLTLLVMSGNQTPVLLLVFTLLIGCGSAVQIPSWQASLRDLVERPDLPAAVAIHAMGFNLMRGAGPAIGGVILAFSGASFLFAIGGFCYLFFAVALFFWRKPVQPDPIREPLGAAFLSGIRYSAMSPKLLHVSARGAVFCTLGVALVALLPVIAEDTFGGGPILFGAFLGSFGVGAVCGALISPALRDKYGIENIMRFTFVASGLAILLIACVANIYVAIPATFLVGSCWVVTNSSLNVTIQMSTPIWVAGRSISILHTGLFGGMAIGSMIWGSVAEVAGLQVALALAGVVLVFTSMMGHVMPLPVIGAQTRCFWPPDRSPGR